MSLKDQYGKICVTQSGNIYVAAGRQSVAVNGEIVEVLCGWGFNGKWIVPSQYTIIADTMNEFLADTYNAYPENEIQ